MNHYTATQLAKDGQPTGLWHYTQTNDGRTWPIGYCADGCPGHATEDEAREHYRQYLLDTAGFDGKVLKAQYPCKVCGAWTDRFAATDIGGTDMYMLCDEHRNRETLEKLMPLPGDAWGTL